jgi:hypothetical protein
LNLLALLVQKYNTDAGRAKAKDLLDQYKSTCLLDRGTNTDAEAEQKGEKRGQRLHLA